ncbi:hypothetical protein DVQ32_11920 [Yersinia enterocolitica]|nr:hypothetical protein [Yersinia enterocolitica]EKN6025788.1 hypothetical protein [Yersinia enterocolitica]
MSLVPEAHPTGSINAVQIGSRPICHSLAAFLQLELFRVYVHSLVQMTVGRKYRCFYRCFCSQTYRALCD